MPKSITHQQKSSSNDVLLFALALGLWYITVNYIVQEILMQTHPFARRTLYSAILACLFAVTAVSVAYAMSVVEFTAVGRVESIYRDRITMRIIEVISSDTVQLPVNVGSWVSFDLPKEYRDRNKSGRRTSDQIVFGTLVKAALIGNVATEYELKKDDAEPEKIVKNVPTVLLWTAQSVVKVKNTGQYDSDEEKTEKQEARKGKKGKKGRSRDKKEKKPEEPLKIWTQEETVRGDVLVKDEQIYIKEERLGRKDKGLYVVTESWSEKLKEFNGSRVVLYGVTHRTGFASGTMEIKSLMRVYPK
ncbi:MAG: hypothetical protein KKB51_02030 [Candidatus Riflebacteria bacterium]|nr:hypothetical protein [Candidatus Riflebacteria bacterium]